MTAGLAELETWLYDTMRLGLAALASQDSDYWAYWQARMVDAQLPGLAQRLGQLAATLSEPHGTGQALDQLGELYLLVRSLQRQDHLSGPWQDQLAQLAGLSVRQEALAPQPLVRGTWLVMGQRTEVQERIDQRRTWLYDLDQGRWALILDFSAAGAPFPPAWPTGQVLKGGLRYYPGPWPQRARFDQAPEPVPAPAAALPPALAPQAQQAAFAAALAQQPFLARWPGLWQGLVLHGSEAQPQLSGPNGEGIPLHATTPRYWELRALSGGGPLDLFGEWDGRHFLPLSAWVPPAWVDWG